MSFSLKVLFFGIVILSIVLTMPSVFADSWYVGKGLKQGDYFRYSVCFIDWHQCAPLELDFWVKNQTSDGKGWNLEMLATDGSNIEKGTVTIGTITPDPIYSDPDISDYAKVYKNTIIWLDAFATSDNPKNFSYTSWGKNLTVGRQTLSPIDQEQVTVQGGTYKTWVIGWHIGEDNKIWVAPNLPFPVKALTWVDCACGRPPPLFNFELLETGNAKTFSEYLMYHDFSHAAEPHRTGIVSPYQQIVNGVLPENVVCSDGLILIKKMHSDSLVCVKPQSAQKLVERGWGILITSMNTTNPESICKASGGQWDEKYRECAGVSNLTCKALNGIYNGCASACRHTPNGGELACAAVCVQTCIVK